MKQSSRHSRQHTGAHLKEAHARLAGAGAGPRLCRQLHPRLLRLLPLALLRLLAAVGWKKAEK